MNLTPKLPRLLLDRIWQFLPGNCLVCGYPLKGLICICEDCESRLPRVGQQCSACGIPLDTEPSTGICGRCLVKPPPFTLCRGAFRYQQPVSKLITDFKFNGNFASGRALAILLARNFLSHYQADTTPSMPDLLVPIPLHRKRLKTRGYDQALLLCKVVSRHTGIAMDGRLLVRTRNTTPQSQLHARQRTANLKNAFQLAGTKINLKLGHIAIVDDVVTTASTAGTVAEVLIKAGAERVDIWALARA